MLDAAEQEEEEEEEEEDAEERGGWEGRGTFDDDGEELTLASLRPSPSPADAAAASKPPKSRSKKKKKKRTNPVCWLAFSSNDEAQGGMGRIRVLAFEKVLDGRGEEDDDADGKKPNPSFPPPAPRPSHPWRATVVAHVRCPGERVHALAAVAGRRDERGRPAVSVHALRL